MAVYNQNMAHSSTKTYPNDDKNMPFTWSGDLTRETIQDYLLDNYKASLTPQELTKFEEDYANFSTTKSCVKKACNYFQKNFTVSWGGDKALADVVNAFEHNKTDKLDKSLVELAKYDSYYNAAETSDIQTTAEIKETEVQVPVLESNVVPDSAPVSEAPNPYKFDIPRPENVSQAAYDNGWRAEQQRQKERELNEQKAAEIMKDDGSMDYTKLNELGSQGYHTGTIASIVEAKNKEKESASAESQMESQTVETAEVAESETKGAAPAEEKPNPYAFEKPERESGMSDEDYENACKLAEAEHIDNVNRQAAADINAGKYGNGEDRKKALAEAGLDYDAVQSIINNEYVPKYEAERAKQAEAAAKQAAAGPSDADIDAALAEAENNNKKIEIKTEASVKDEVEAIKADVTATFDSQKTPAGEAQAMAKALERKAQEGRPLTDEELRKYKSEPVAEMGDDFSFEPKESSVEDELEAVRADMEANSLRTPLGEAQAIAKVLERKAQECRPLTDEELEKYKNSSVAEMGDDYSFEPKDADKAENTIPGVEYDENGEAVVIHGDEPAPVQNNNKSSNKTRVKNFRVDEINAPTDTSGKNIQVERD